MLATPWCVNLLALVPFAVFAVWRRRGPHISWERLALLAAFAMAFGFAEASVVVYLRAAAGMLPGAGGTLADLRNAAASYAYSQTAGLAAIPAGLLRLEALREAATMVMLATTAWLGAARWRERCACFLWAFAVWDIAYYAGLRALVRWPGSWGERDVLFLIPVPWLAQVWFPIGVSAMTLVAIAVTNGGRGTARADGDPPR